MDDDFIPEEFDAVVEGSAKLIEARQGQRVVKEGEITLTGTVDRFVGQINDGGKIKNQDMPTVPKVRMAKTQDGREYPAQIVLYARISNLALVPNEVVKLEGGRDGWKVRASLKYFAAATEWLRDVARAVHTATDSVEAMRVRKFVTEDGNTISTTWLDYTPGHEVKIKISDGKDNIFRQCNPNNKNAPLVQPSTPMRFTKVVPEVWVDVKEREVDDPDAVKKEGEEPKKRKEKYLVTYPAFVCRGGVQVSEDYDPNMSRSELLHEQENKNAHPMVPIREWREHRATPQSAVYFYVKPRHTKFGVVDVNPDAKGVTVKRMPPLESDFYYTKQGEKIPSVNVRFHYWQWRAGDAKWRNRNQYVVSIRGESNDTVWRQYGIPDLEAYGMIVSANQDLPLHVYCKLWDRSTLDHPANAPDELENPEPKPMTEDIVGYYSYGNATIVPDFLRFFRTNGIRVSQEWAAAEFKNWASTTAGGRRELKLAPLVPEVPNPVNSNGVHGAVIALGNGKLLNPDAKTDDERAYGKYHAFNGNAVALFEGNHDFFVLTSKVMSEQEHKEYSGTGKYADSYVDALKNPPVNAFYWVYAVRKDAKMATDFVTPLRVPGTVDSAPATTSATPKREREGEVDGAAEDTSTKKVALEVN